MPLSNYLKGKGGHRMNVKTMEGLAGADTSIRMIATPMSVAKEAENKGDTEKLKRALSYASEMTEQAGAYSEKTSQGMKLDAKEAKEQEKLRQEEQIKEQKEKREEQQGSIESSKEPTKGAAFDSVEISEEGKKNQTETADLPASAPVDSSPNTVYDPSGEIAAQQAAVGENVDIHG